MHGKREPIEKFYMNVLTQPDNKDLEYEFNIANRSVVSVMWGSLCYRIIREQLCCDPTKPCKGNKSCKVSKYNIPSKSQSFDKESKFKTYLLDNQLNVTLARLILVDKDELKFKFEFEVSKIYGSPSDKYDTKIGEDWIKPRCIKLTYPEVSAYFQPEDIFTECRLRSDLANKHLPNHAHNDDGNITGVFFCIEGLDCVKHILIPFYKSRPASTDIEDIVTQARIAKRGNFIGPVSKMNHDKINRFWDYTYEEYGVDRKLSYLLKAGKCPIGAFR